MNIVAEFDKPYVPRGAEDGKFVVLDPTTITGLPSTSEGRFAVLTYQTNPLSLSGASIDINTLDVDTTMDMPLALSAGDITTVSFVPNIQLLEVYNNDGSDVIHIGFNTYADLPALSSTGLPIKGDVLYSIERDTTQVTVGCVAGSADVRIFGHYKI